VGEPSVDPLRITDPAIGTAVNGYRIVGRLGEGGMGVVYEGLEPDIGKRVAIKVIQPELAADPTFITRLLDEARAVNAIRHRGIVDIFGAGALLDGRKCILMEYLEGVTLDFEIRLAAQSSRTMPLMRVLTICDEVLNALDAAHLANIVHRDLKPSNIFLCRQPNGEQHVKLLDFGIAKVAGRGNTTSPSGVVGTPMYMAPEQAIADRLTSAVDLYAFGVILFELLTGRPPFSGESVARVMFHHLQSPAPLPSERNPAIPAALDRVVASLLAKQPQERPSASETRRELARVRVALSDPTAMTTLDEANTPVRSHTLAYSSSVGGDSARIEVPPTETPTVQLSDTLPRVQPASLVAPAHEAPLDPKAPAADAQRAPEAPPAVSSPSEVAVSRAPSRSRNAPVVGALGLAIMLAAGVTWVIRRAGESPVEPPVRPSAEVIAPAAAAPEPPPAEPPAMQGVTTPEVSHAAADPTAPPKPAQVAKPRTTPTGVELRLARLEAAIAKAKSRGDDMEVAERQVNQLRARFAAAKTPHDREALEVALSRIEEELKE